MISLNQITNCESDLGLLNSLLKSILISASDARGLSVKYLMYQVSMRSWREVTNCAFFILSSIIYCEVHTMFTTNHNCSNSSLHIPLNTDIFISFTRLEGGGGGVGVGRGVCGGGRGGGGVDGWFILGIPWVINWTPLCDIVCRTLLSSHEGGSINGLYFGHDPSQFVKNRPLCVALNMKVMTSRIFHITKF